MIPETCIGSIAIGCCICCEFPCCGTVGYVISGSPNTLNENRPVSRIGDIVIAPCGTGTIVTGVPNVLMNNIPVATIGSSVVGCFNGSIVTGSITVVTT